MQLLLFKAFRFVYRCLDKLVMILLGQHVRLRLSQIAQRIKAKLFPDLHMDAGPDRTDGIPPIPKWVLEEMHELARCIDPVLAPTPAFISSCHYYNFPLVAEPGRLYRKLISRCRSKCYTHCFAIPWLKTGGADLVTLHHILFLAKQSNTRVLVIITEPGVSPWLNRIPANVDVLDFSSLVDRISYDEIIQVLVRLLVQLEIHILHIINSRHAWDALCKYGLAVRQRSRVYASLFCDDYDADGYHVGYARTFLPQTYRLIEHVFTDNERFPMELRQAYGYQHSLFKVIRSPIELPKASSSTCTAIGRRVMWAGRLDRQKRPDLLLSIAQAMPDVIFSVYGEQLMGQKNIIIDQLASQQNVEMLGAIDGVESLPFNAYKVFLYTSQWDGLPTIILAAACAGIPIVASDVGGVGEIVTEEFGYPIHDIESITEYVEAITKVLEYPDIAAKKAKLVQSYIRLKHSQENFEITLRGVNGYLPVSSAEGSLCDA